MYFLSTGHILIYYEYIYKGNTDNTKDKTLERCFGVKKLVSDCDWNYLQTLKSTQDPNVGIPRLVDLLELLVQPGAEGVWAFLDIKVFLLPSCSFCSWRMLTSHQLDNPPSIMKKIADDLATVTSSTPWTSRLVLGVWSASYIPSCQTYLPSVPIAIICFDVSYARQILRIPNADIGFNISQKMIMGPLGRGFVEEAKGKGRAVYAWTVNERNLMGWCVRKGVDGIVTDFPEIAREVAEGWGGKNEGMQEKVRFGQKVEVWVLSALLLLFGWIFRKRFLGKVERVGVEVDGKSK